jgi:hypothetical protein
MFDPHNVALNQLREQEQHDRAVKMRLINEVLHSRPARVRIFRPAMARLGASLIRVGTDLQRRYGEQVTTHNVPRRSFESA